VTDSVYRCPEHGYFDGDTCDCEGATVVVDGETRVRLSKFLSGALRHFPDDAGLTLDDAGWTPYEELVHAAVSRYDRVQPEHVDAVVATDPKGRFERAGGRIRAAYGHSVDVELDGGGGTPEDIPDTLYHGTARRNVGSIRQKGVVPRGRNEVYLSETVEQARRVGDRHGDSVVFEVEASTLDVVRRGDGVYAVERVPPEVISLL
jgi:putative RNA 2'-phosphotransferase